MVIIKSKRFLLRPYRKGDEKSLVENINDWKVTQFMSNIPYPYTSEDARKWIKKCIKITKKIHKTRIDFAIDVNGEVVGGIDLHSIEKHKVEIGYWLARKIWKPEELKYLLLAPSQVVHFGLLVELCPEIVAEVRKVPKVAIFAEDDRLVGMRKRGMDLIKIFEGFGNIKSIVLKGMGHDLDYNGDGHTLYIEPVLIKHFYDFFLLVAQQ